MKSEHAADTRFVTFYTDSGVELVGLAESLMMREGFYSVMTEMLRTLELNQEIHEPEEEVFV